MPRVGLLPTNAAGERLYTYALDRAATRIGSLLISATQIIREEVPMEANICNDLTKNP